MKLLYTPNSPYARKVRIVAMEKHIELEMLEVVLSDPNCPVKQYNPLGKIPVLVLDDGDSLYDSPVICEYLDHRAPVARLIPAENNFRIDVLRWQALADGVCDAAVAVVLEQRKPEEQQSKTTIERQLGKVIAGLELMDRDITKKKWCVDETFSLADIALGCALGYVDLRLKDMHWQDKYTNLAKHYSILTKRPSFKETAPV